ncbi:signal transduction histidine kinase [Salirhabdus euzebyi]|uniref:histidine kinase n=1 Tax=Salirhabdus euzebyi TaxID=394506 RepID=A0A841Q857_9BACI|nr:HAMP domain-containing sensor histidine kinase [Salirhabdus euzebyi]MBB6454477.1 signal transduction histidine kinase [Salirhabdus euzebyi]
MKKGIKRRIVWSYLLLIIFSVAVFEAVIISALMVYYTGGVKQTLRDQGAIFSSFYERDLIEGELENKAEQLLSQYNFTVNAQVQLIDTKGNILAENYSSNQKNILSLNDVKLAVNGKNGFLTSKKMDEKLLSVSYPLKSGNTTYGVIRLTTSMKQTNDILIQNSILLLIVGGIVICLAAALSLFLTNSITKPITTITRAAERIAAGNFQTRIEKVNEDEIGKLADTLNFMTKEVERHEQLKNEFIASISHDLRTPLTSVKGWAVTLQTLTDEEVFKEGLEIITNESDRLNEMLNDLLDLSSLTSGKLSFTYDTVVLHLLIKQVIFQMEPRAKRQNVKIIADLDESILHSKLDKNRLKQVFINIFDNALKFTPMGGRIVCRLKREENNAIIQLEDTGIGISDKDLPFVKEKFYKGQTPGSGSGLGLAICEEIIKAHQGTFKITSEASKGTLVEIVLPL